MRRANRRGKNRGQRRRGSLGVFPFGSLLFDFFSLFQGFWLKLPILPDSIFDEVGTLHSINGMFWTGAKGLNWIWKVTEFERALKGSPKDGALWTVHFEERSVVLSIKGRLGL